MEEEGDSKESGKETKSDTENLLERSREGKVCLIPLKISHLMRKYNGSFEESNYDPQKPRDSLLSAFHFETAVDPLSAFSTHTDDKDIIVDVTFYLRVAYVLGLLSWSTCCNYCFTSKEFNDDQVPYEHGQNYLDDKTWGMGDNHSLPTAFAPDSDSWIASGSQITRINSPTNFSMKKTCVASTDAQEKSSTLKQSKKRKIDSDTMSSITSMVKAEITFNGNVKIFNFHISLGLLSLKNEVAQWLKLKGKNFGLKYVDEENDLILIACDVDLKLAVDTAAINNRIKLLCLLDGNHGICDALLESVADNFMLLGYSSDSESLVVNGSTDTGENGNQSKKRKTVIDLMPPVTGMVTAKITFKKYKKIFKFFVSSGLSNLKNEVARSFKLKGKKLRLKYRDKDDDLILIACDVDLKLAVVTTGCKNSINLICLSD
ncbi:hypothetical protein E3N88_30838 [Mikania micrantha]|uniref:PB1 domain-containing protein n=1 Tax=Mikania micrantha TaxID=192012 RepID=A0A5N6MQR6_9ASTR|nr:hypothetical protein E3N88_30838 [Mikania micrantha]